MANHSTHKLGSLNTAGISSCIFPWPCPSLIFKNICLCLYKRLRKVEALKTRQTCHEWILHNQGGMIRSLTSAMCIFECVHVCENKMMTWFFWNNAGLSALLRGAVCFILWHSLPVKSHFLWYDRERSKSGKMWFDWAIVLRKQNFAGHSCTLQNASAVDMVFIHVSWQIWHSSWVFLASGSHISL